MAHQMRVTNEITGDSMLVNGWTSKTCAATVEEAMDRLGAVDSFTKVEGRRRLNDYVGSPIWSDWEQV